MFPVPSSPASSRTSSLDHDLVLVSSDNVVHVVDPEKIAEASPIFKSKLESVPEITDLRLIFSDRTIETSKVLGLFIDLIYGKELQVTESSNNNNTSGWHDAQGYIALVTFLKKYQATTALRDLRVSMFSWLEMRAMVGERLLIMAMALEDYPLCAEIVGESWSSPHPRYLLGRYDRRVPSEPTISPDSIPFFIYKAMPYKARFALVRACQKTQGISRNKNAWWAVSEEFERIMKDLM
ncbi:hypothetical protein IAR55_004447 [Kwoniella newhampshirensis]|uniref:BTB domain-containing protein n=1 Tax=Kwoniella newhampshirensis TaxID=1651941 RepID=A0AAW0YXP6_9TREE